MGRILIVFEYLRSIPSMKLQLAGLLSHWPATTGQPQEYSSTEVLVLIMNSGGELNTDGISADSSSLYPILTWWTEDTSFVRNVGVVDCLWTV